jgi:hypothetical protein
MMIVKITIYGGILLTKLLKRKAWATLITAMLTLFIIVISDIGIAQAQNAKRLQWNHYDVTIDNFDTVANRFDVIEAYELEILQGSFSFGTASIPSERLTGISNVRVFYNDHALTAGCNGNPGTFCFTHKSGGTFDIRYNFTSSARAGNKVRVRLHYTVTGALRSYPGGDQLWWVAIPEDLPFPVVDSRVTVKLPVDKTPSAGTSYPDDWQVSREGNTTTWTPPSTGNVGGVEVRLEYAHDPAMQAPPWQSTYDRERLQNGNPRFMTAIAGSVLILILFLIRP